MKIRNATCALCARALEGVPVPEEKIAEYRASKGGRRGDVSMLRLPPESELQGDPFSMRSLGSGIAHAFGFQKPPKEDLESVKTAKKKRRKPIFTMPDDADEITSFGSMQDVDAALKPK